MKIITAGFTLCFASFAVAAQGTATFTESPKPAQAAPTQQPSAATSPAPASAAVTKIDPAKEGANRKLLDTSGAANIASQSMASMAATLRPLLLSSLPPGEYREKLVELFYQKFQARLDGQQILDLAVPIYDKYFTMEEIEGLTQFYRTPLGQKTISTMPTVMSEMRNAGKQFGEKLGRDAMIEVLDEHPDLKRALEEAGASQKKN